MELKSVTPMLRTPDVKSTVAFYTEILGFVCDGFNDDWTWASLRRDGAGVMFVSPEDTIAGEQPHLTGSLYFLTDDVDALWEEMRDRTRVAFPLDDQDYGMREFGIYDNNGYLLRFGEVGKR